MPTMRSYRLTLLFAVAIVWSDRTALAQLPNIVVLYADDMGWGDLGVQNAESKIPTPNLDRLAREGMRFTDAHSSSGVCSTSRYALLTGRYHWRRFHGIVDTFGPSVLEPERVTLPELLRARGYVTACVGKWHLGWDWDALLRDDTPAAERGRGRRARRADEFDWSRPIPDGPLAHGFDHYFGDDVPNFPPYAWILDDRVVDAPDVAYSADPAPTEGAPEGRPGPMVRGWKQDAVMPRLTEHVLEWLEQRSEDERPFFLFFSWTSPHAPILPTKPYQGATKAGGYGDFLFESDAYAGRVLDKLDELGLAEDTIVVFSSDNGPEHYAYERVRATGHRSMGPLRGVKRDLWEGGHRVPFVVRWPGVVEAGAVSDALIGQVDLYATFAAIAGATLPDDAAEDSIDQSPVWRGESAALRDELVHNTNANGYAMRRGRWVLIDAAHGGVTKVPAWFDEAEGHRPRDPGPALYDLEADLGQRDDVSAEHAGEVAELRARLARIRADGHSAPRLRGR